MPISPEEKPCNDVAERIIGLLGTRAIERVTSALNIDGECLKILIDLEKKAINLLGAGELLEKLEDALYQADDILNEKSFPSKEKTTNIEVYDFPCSAIRLQYVKRKIRRITKKLVERRAKEGLIDPSGGLLESMDLVGRDGDREETLKLLLGNDEKMERSTVEDVSMVGEEGIGKSSKVKVVAIVGEGGIGKTQLANLVFKDDLVQKNFQARLWFSRFDTLEDQLRSNAHKNIDGKRFLIVLDDLCYEDFKKFSRFGDLLRYGAEGSRVIVTTQTEEVAQSFMVEVLGGHELDYEDEKMIYHLGCLDEKASFALLKNSIQLSQRQGVDENLNEVLKKCGGKPLAIRTIGSMWYLENLGTEWQNTFDIWEKQKKTRERENALRVIKSNYEHFPAYLKPCFAYCSLFPKNYEFDVPTLVRLWISQGFVACLSEDDCPEDVADKYVMELQERLFFEEVKRDEWGALRSCKMQSLMYDLAKEIAGVECAALRLEEEKNIQEKTHHVLFDFHLDSPWQLPDSLYKAKRIRTIILHSQLQWQIEGRSGTSICDTIVSNFKFLRTLDLHNSGIKVVSDNIGKLKNLKYLDLSQNTDIKELPKSICELSSLQTLKLNHCGRLQVLPRKIKKLTSLRNLEIDSCYSLTHMPCGIGELTNLQTLSEFVLKNDADFVSKRSADMQLDELKNLNNLKGELRIKNLSIGIDAMKANLHEKKHLRSLVLIWDIEPVRSGDKKSEEKYFKPNSIDLSDAKRKGQLKSQRHGEDIIQRNEVKPKTNDLHEKKIMTQELKSHSNDVKDEETKELEPNFNDREEEETTTKELKTNMNDLNDENTKELKPCLNDNKEEKTTTEELKYSYSDDVEDEKATELEPNLSDHKEEKTTKELKTNMNDLNGENAKELKPCSNDNKEEKMTEELKYSHSNDVEDDKKTELEPNLSVHKEEETTTKELKTNMNDLNDENAKELKPCPNDDKEEKTTEELKYSHSNDVEDDKATELEPNLSDHQGEETTTKELKANMNDLNDENAKELNPCSNDNKEEKTAEELKYSYSNDVEDDKTTELEPNLSDHKEEEKTTKELKTSDLNDENTEFKPQSYTVDEKQISKEPKASSNDLIDNKMIMEELKPHLNDLNDEKITANELNPVSNDFKEDKEEEKFEELKPHSNLSSDEKTTANELNPVSNDLKEEDKIEELKPLSNHINDEKTIEEEMKPNSNVVKDEGETMEEMRPYSNNVKDEKVTTEELEPNVNGLNNEEKTSKELNDEKTTTDDIIGEKSKPEELQPQANDLKDESTTDKLKPHSNLKELSLFAYPGVEFPTWVSLKAELIKLSLWKCMKWHSLPSLNHLGDLQVLALEDMANLECISEKVESQIFFPSLIELRLVDLPKLKSWWSYKNKTPNKPEEFLSLSKLTIEDCRSLISLPTCPKLKYLVLKNTSWTPVQWTKTTTTERPLLLPQLETLRLVCISIFDLNKHWESLSSLQSLTLDHLPYLENLPEGLQHLKNLKELHIWRCNKLKDLSDSVGQFKSLEKLSLKLCLNLTLSIQMISSLASIKTKMEFEDCPEIKVSFAMK